MIPNLNAAQADKMEFPSENSCSHHFSSAISNHYPVVHNHITIKWILKNRHALNHDQMLTPTCGHQMWTPSRTEFVNQNSASLNKLSKTWNLLCSACQARSGKEFPPQNFDEVRKMITYMWCARRMNLKWSWQSR